MKITTRFLTDLPPWVLCTAATAAMPIAAVAELPRDLTAALRCIACLAAVLLAYRSWTWGRISALWLFGLIAAAVNPLAPFLLGREIIHVPATLRAIHLAIAAVFAAGIFILRPPTAQPAVPNRPMLKVLLIGVLASMFAWAVADSLTAAVTCRSDGYVPVYAGSREREVVGEEWADAGGFRRHLLGQAGVHAFLGIGCVVWMVCAYRKVPDDAERSRRGPTDSVAVEQAAGSQPDQKRPKMILIVRRNDQTPKQARVSVRRQLTGIFNSRQQATEADTAELQEDREEDSSSS